MTSKKQIILILLFILISYSVYASDTELSEIIFPDSIVLPAGFDTSSVNLELYRTHPTNDESYIWKLADTLPYVDIEIDTSFNFIIKSVLNSYGRNNITLLLYNDTNLADSKDIKIIVNNIPLIKIDYNDTILFKHSTINVPINISDTDTTDNPETFEWKLIKGDTLTTSIYNNSVNLTFDTNGLYKFSVVTSDSYHYSNTKYLSILVIDTLTTVYNNKYTYNKSIFDTTAMALQINDTASVTEITIPMPDIKINNNDVIGTYTIQIQPNIKGNFYIKNLKDTSITSNIENLKPGSYTLGEATIIEFDYYSYNGFESSETTILTNAIINFNYTDYYKTNTYDSSRLYITYYKNDKWIPEYNTSRDYENNILSVTVNHFSKFGIFSLNTYDTPGADYGNVLIYPNPFRPNDNNPKTGITYSNNVKSSGIYITGLIPESIIKIYSLRGELINELNVPSNTGAIIWNAENKQGEPLSSGIYLMYIKHSDKQVVKKVAIVR